MAKATKSVVDQVVDIMNAPIPGKATKKAPAKKALSEKAKKATKTEKAKAPTKKAEAPKKDKGEVKWSEVRVSIVKAMKALKATTAMGARSSADIATKAGVEEKQVKHYCYHEEQLQKAGLVAQVKMEDVKGLAYYLTAAGAKASV